MKAYKQIIIALMVLTTIILLSAWASAGTDSVSDFDSDFTRKEEVTVSVRDEQNDWSDLTIKYGLIGEAGVLVYSDDPLFRDKSFDYYHEFETINTGIGLISAEQEVRLKFSVGTHMTPINNQGWLGFFYEFIPSTSEVLSVQPNTLKYYPTHQMFVNPNRYHIYLSDLIEMYGKDKVEVVGNKVFIYVLDNGRYYNFDPPIGGDGIPLDCIASCSASYNETTIDEGEDFKMGGKITYGATCSNPRLNWLDNTTGSWATIPSLALDLSCSASTCSQSSPTSNTWYYRYPTCEVADEYFVRVRCDYNDHDGIPRSSYTSIQTIDCSDPASQYRNVTLLYPDNATEYDLDSEVTFYANSSTTYPNELIKSMTLQHTVSGSYADNLTWYPHHPVRDSSMFTLYWNNTNTSLEGHSPVSGTNESINLVDEGCFFDDMTCANLSADSGRFFYDAIVFNVTEGTICWWMYFFSDYTTTSKIILWNIYSSDENIYFAWGGADQMWYFKKETGGNNYLLKYNPPSDPDAGDLNHICMGWDDSFTGIYIDGELEASSTGYGSPQYNASTLELFGSGNPASNCDCLVDEIVIYNERLSTEEIENLYLQKNYTVNFTNQGWIAAGDYDWNVQAETYTGEVLFYHEHNWTFTILGVEVSVPIHVLDTENIQLDLWQRWAIIGGVVIGIILLAVYIEKKKEE